MADFPTFGPAPTIHLTPDQVADVDPQLAEHMHEEFDEPMMMFPSTIEEYGSD